jgi:hypothetical protein
MRRVWPDTRESLKLRRRSGEPSAIPFHNDLRQFVQSHRPVVVSHSLPCDDDVSLLCRCQVADGRETAEELRVLEQDTLDLRLLKHHLGDKDAVSVGDVAPRKRSSVGGVP